MGKTPRTAKHADGPIRWVVLILGLALACVLSVHSCAQPPRITHGGGLFSWHGSALEEDGRAELFACMEELGLTELYQHIPGDAASQAVADFLKEAQRHGIAVYLLTGDPGWGLDRTGRAMRGEIARAAGYAGIQGVVMDVEPYLTQDWEDDRDEAMERYVQAMIRARKAADARGLELVACIPYFYDTKGQAGRLETLAERGCHALAVMNYDKKDEAANLETEASLAGRYGRPLITIYELQAPGKHDLTERNTYHDDGLGPLAASWEALKQVYPDTALTYALHDYTALKEVLSRE